MARSPGVRLAIAVAVLAALGSPCLAQGGWRQWDVYLRDGKRVEANPLGAPDSAHVSLSVGAFEGREATIPLSRIDYLAAQTTVGPSREPVIGGALPPAPTARVREDLVVWRDGHRTRGRVALTRVAYSAGVITQRGVEIDLADIAYIKFARAQQRENKSRVPSCHVCTERSAREISQ
jgi:hypothetical protein